MGIQLPIFSRIAQKVASAATILGIQLPLPLILPKLWLLRQKICSKNKKSIHNKKDRAKRAKQERRKRRPASAKPRFRPSYCIHAAPCIPYFTKLFTNSLIFSSCICPSYASCRNSCRYVGKFSQESLSLYAMIG